MRANSLIMLGLAAVFGVGAVILSRNWLERQAQRNQPQPVAISAPVREDVPMETVVVAASGLKFGTEIKREQLKEVRWPSGSLPAGTYRSLGEIFTSEGKRVALGQIETNEPILISKISGPGQRATLSAVIGEGMNAVTVRVDDVNGVAGFLTPGDRVDVILTRERDEGGPLTELLLENARVLAVDQAVEQRAETPVVPKVVTLEVESTAAQHVAFASAAGKISLVLRRAGEVAQPEDRSKHTRETKIAVGRGTKRQEYAVRSEATN